MTEKRYREFVLYFRALDGKGINWGMSDLRRKAKELNLPIPNTKVKIEGNEIISLHM